MNKKEFSNIRHHLGKTQVQMAQLLGVSLKAVQSFEQGWRNITVHAERQSLLLLSLKEHRRNVNCWTAKQCDPETRRSCPAWEFKAGHVCWLINGTICEGKPQRSWSKKMKLCRKCKVFESALAPLARRSSAASREK